jgi:hypothetical protein
MMKDLSIEINTAMMMEYKRAAAKFGDKSISRHESYAVIFDEFVEAIEQEDTFENCLANFWIDTKRNKRDDAKQRLADMCEIAQKAAAEWVQVAAMCYKAAL